MLYIWQNFRLSDWDTFEQSPRAVKPFFITSMKNITQKNVIVKSGPSRSLQITFRPHSIKQHSKSVAVLITFFLNLQSFLCFSPGFFWISQCLPCLSFAKKGAKGCLRSECFCCCAFLLSGGCHPASCTDQAALLAFAKSPECSFSGPCET